MPGRQRAPGGMMLMCDTHASCFLQPAAQASGSVPVECMAVRQAAQGIKTFEFKAPKGLRYQPGMYVSFDLQVGLARLDYHVAVASGFGYSGVYAVPCQGLPLPATSTLHSRFNMITHPHDQFNIKARVNMSLGCVLHSHRCTLQGICSVWSGGTGCHKTLPCLASRGWRATASSPTARGRCPATPTRQPPGELSLWAPMF